jgi:hypothetical protein
MGRKNRILRYFKKFGKKYANHPYVKANMEKTIEDVEPASEEKVEVPIKEELEEIKPIVEKSVTKKTTTRKKPTTKTSRTKRTKPKAQ